MSFWVDYPYSHLNENIKNQIKNSLYFQKIYKDLGDKVKSISVDLNEKEMTYFTDCLFTIHHKYSQYNTSQKFLNNKLKSLVQIKNFSNPTGTYAGLTSTDGSITSITMNKHFTSHDMDYLDTAMHELIHAMSRDDFFHPTLNRGVSLINGFDINDTSSIELSCVHLTNMLMEEYFDEEIQLERDNRKTQTYRNYLSHRKNILGTYSKDAVYIDTYGKSGYYDANAYSNLMFAMDGDEIQSLHFKVGDVNGFNPFLKNGTFDVFTGRQKGMHECFVDYSLDLSKKYKGLNEALKPLTYLGPSGVLIKDTYSNANNQYCLLAKEYIDSNNLDLNDYIHFTQKIRLNMKMDANGQNHNLNDSLIRTLDVYYIYNKLIKNPTYADYIKDEVKALNIEDEAIFKAYNPKVKNPELEYSLSLLNNARNGFGGNAIDFLNSLTIPRNENYPIMSKREIENLQSYTGYLSLQPGITENEQKITRILNSKGINNQHDENLVRNSELFKFRNIPFVGFDKDLLMNNLRFSDNLDSFKSIVYQMTNLNPKCMEYYLSHKVDVDGIKMNPIEYCIRNKKYEYLNVLANLEGIDYSNVAKTEITDVQTLAYYNKINTSISDDINSSWFNFVKVKNGYIHNGNNDRAIFDLIDNAYNINAFSRDLKSLSSLFGDEIGRVYDKNNNNQSLGDAFYNLSRRRMQQENFILVGNEYINNFVVEEALKLMETYHSVKFDDNIFNRFACSSLEVTFSKNNLDRIISLADDKGYSLNFKAIVDNFMLNKNVDAMSNLVSNQKVLNNLNFETLSEIIDFSMSQNRPDIIQTMYDTYLKDFESKSILDIKQFEVFNNTVQAISQQYDYKWVTEYSNSCYFNLINNFGYDGLKYENILLNAVKEDNYQLMKDTLLMMSNNNIDIASVNSEKSYYLAIDKFLRKNDLETIFEIANNTMDEKINFKFLKECIFESCVESQNFGMLKDLGEKFELTAFETQRVFVEKLKNNELNFEQFDNILKVVGHNENLKNVENSYYVNACFFALQQGRGDLVEKLLNKYDEVSLFGIDVNKGLDNIEFLQTLAKDRGQLDVFNVLENTKQNYSWKVEEVNRQGYTKDLDMIRKEVAAIRYADKTLDIDLDWS